MRFASVVLAALLLGLAVSGCQDPNSPAARPEMMFPGGGGGGGGGGSTTPSASVGLDIGIMVATVRITAITMVNKVDWFGPYYLMTDDLYTPSYVTPASTEVKGSFGAGGGCANCWQYSYTFVTLGDAVMSFGLYDDQGWLGMQPVTIAGGSNNVVLLLAGRTCSINGTVALVKLTAADACASYSFSTTGSGTGGSRSATVQGTITLRSGLQYQSAMRQQLYQRYTNLMGDLDFAASICYQRWQGEVAEMQGQLLPLIAIGFGFASLGQGLAEGILQNQFLVPAIEAADFMSHVRDYASHSVTFSAQSLFDCGDIHLLWWYLQQPVAPSGARQLRGAVSSVLNDLTVVLTDLPTGDRSKVTADFATQVTDVGAAVSGDGSLVQYLQSLASGTAPNPGVCLDCRSAASILVTKLFQPMYAELASDRGYVASTYQLLRP